MIKWLLSCKLFCGFFQELREDNQVLIDTRHMLEEQLEVSHSRVERVVQLEAELLSSKKQMSDMAAVSH